MKLIEKKSNLFFISDQTGRTVKFIKPRACSYSWKFRRRAAFKPPPSIVSSGCWAVQWVLFPLHCVAAVSPLCFVGWGSLCRWDSFSSSEWAALLSPTAFPRGILSPALTLVTKEAEKWLSGLHHHHQQRGQSPEHYRQPDCQSEHRGHVGWDFKSEAKH